MAENFSPNGTSVASSTVGIIDDPNFTVYVGITGNDISGNGSIELPYRTPHKAVEHLRNFFITRNGFATIKCGAGRYTFINSLEFRHPQGQRIGIRGGKAREYILAKCSDWRSSHASIADNRPSELSGLAGTGLRGTSACRYYEATVHLQDLDWETSGNKLEPESVSSKKGMGVENYVTGDYALVRDYTFAHQDDYDNFHNDFGEDAGTNGQGQASVNFRNKNSSRRAPLIGAHPIKDNDRDGTIAGDEIGFVKYDCKYYNFPHVTRFTSTVSNAGEGVSWWGGFIGKESSTATDFDIPLTDVDSDHMCSPQGRGDYFSNPYPDDASLGSNQTVNPVRFGNTAEGWNNVAEVPTTKFEGYKYNSTSSGYNLDIQKIRTSEVHHCTLNRMTLTHVRTVFEMKNTDKPCIVIEGGELGYIQDLVLEGAWQQFSKHMNDKTPAQYKMGASNHSGIDVTEGTLLYELGTTGDSSGANRVNENAVLRNHDEGTNTDSAAVTTHNVGINGFYRGVLVRHSSVANVDDIAISNCRTGISVESGSHAHARRSVISGMQEYGIVANRSGSVNCVSSMITQVGFPYFALSYYNKGTDGITTGLSRKSFREGDSLVQDTSAEQKFGIVRSHSTNSGYPGTSYITMYDYFGRGIQETLPTKADLETNGLKLEHTGNETVDGVEQPIQTGDATTFFDTHPTTGYLKLRNIIHGVINNAPGMKGYGAYSHAGELNCDKSAFFDIGRAAVISTYGANVYACNCVIHRGGYWGIYALGNSWIHCCDTRILNCRTGFQAGHSSSITCNNSSTENVVVPVRAVVNSRQHAWGMYMIEGLSRYVEHLYEIQVGSYCNKSTLHFVGVNKAGPLVPEDYPANYEDMFSPTSIDYTGYGNDWEGDQFGDVDGDD